MTHLWESKPEVRDFLDRVWQGRQALRSTMRLSDETFVVVDNFLWAHLISASREIEQTILGYQHEDGASILRVWGLPVRVSEDLKVGEIRFRAEVVV